MAAGDGGSMEKPIAKTKAPVNLRLIDGYRHELGSAVDAGQSEDELLLHLIASHHAAGRPFFEQRHTIRSHCAVWKGSRSSECDGSAGCRRSSGLGDSVPGALFKAAMGKCRQKAFRMSELRVKWTH